MIWVFIQVFKCYVSEYWGGPGVETSWGHRVPSGTDWAGYHPYFYVSTTVCTISVVHIFIVSHNIKSDETLIEHAV